MSGYRDVQRALAAHIRDPGRHPGPQGVEARRLRIYSDLFYNNIEDFLAGTFPVLRAVLEDAVWLALVRAFIRDHRCTSPYFLKISEEFIEWLRGADSELPLPPYIHELVHYEWVELTLDVDPANPAAVDAVDGDWLTGIPVLSPLAWPLVYQYPVHRIGPGFSPQQAPREPTWLLVYRNGRDQVGFIEINQASARLISVLQTRSLTGADLVLQLAAELGQPQDMLQTHLLALLDQWRALEVVLGVRPVA
ncbi:MAG: putative DNA-binding domain-containing protein [Spongiibacteraceae bacterium]|nr:putative DNA-binding domain-containing protein [Spongiibacteraceae bacterium]